MSLVVFKWRGSCNCLIIYQTAHLLTGFISLLRGQLKSEANCGIFANGPLTRKRDGVCWPVVISILMSSGRDFLHQMLAALIQNNWRGLWEKWFNDAKKKKVVHAKFFYSKMFQLYHRLYLNCLRPGRRASTWFQCPKPMFCRFAHLI